MAKFAGDPRLQAWIKLWAKILAASCAGVILVVVGMLWVLNGFRGLGMSGATAAKARQMRVQPARVRPMTRRRYARPNPAGAFKFRLAGSGLAGQATTPIESLRLLRCALLDWAPRGVAD